MLLQFFIQFIIFKFCVAQLNGEFWWLNDKLAKFQEVRPPPPKFERLTEFDTDESAKIVFRDDNLINNIEEFVDNKNNKNIEEKASAEFADNVVKWPEQEKKKTDGASISDQQSVEELNESPDEIGDKFVFKFPENDNFVWKYLINTSTSSPTSMQNKSSSKTNSTNSPVLYNDKISFNINYKESESESICSFIKKAECYRKNGTIYNNK